ncbi:MAG: 23S rRNA (guanosine(2251)-2'-O)-methyltransferase RlmB, partial [Proteobacteria bacterium]|nr:23S rRNA (guanosine(2251)-2'-O)-methyltransferase RlmB [Pseudomonadota bacterium]
MDASRGDPRMRELAKLARDAGLTLHEVEGARIERMCAGKRHQGVVAFVESVLPTLSLEEFLDGLDETESSPVTLLLLDGVTDPR